MDASRVIWKEEMTRDELTTSVANCFTICIPAPKWRSVRLAIGAGDGGRTWVSIVGESGIDIALCVLIELDQSWIDLLLRRGRV